MYLALSTGVFFLLSTSYYASAAQRLVIERALLILLSELLLAGLSVGIILYEDGGFTKAQKIVMGSITTFNLILYYGAPLSTLLQV